MSIRLLDNVKLSNLSTQTLLAMIVAEDVFNRMANVELVITSANDSKHSPTSLHYVGNAFDCRVKHVVTDDATGDDLTKAIAAEIKDRLGVDFDVVTEDLGTSNQHIHIEYQPRYRA